MFYETAEQSPNICFVRFTAGQLCCLFVAKNLFFETIGKLAILPIQMGIIPIV